MNQQIYDNMMSNPPIIDRAYLIKVLSLRKTQYISDIKVDQVTESNTALVVKFKIVVKKDGHTDLTRRFLIKTIRNNPKALAYHTLSLKEVEFYKYIQNDSYADLPIAHCFDAYISDDKTKYLLLLEDVSNEFDASNKVDLASENIWLSSACSLAKFHASFWNSDIIGSNDLPIDTMERINFYINNTYESYDKFIKYVGSRFDAETHAIYEHVIKISVSLQTERYERLTSRDNITVKHGDSHIHNFMFPHNQSKTPIIIDFQFWGPGIGVGDVAHLTRVSFPKVFREKLHRSIMEKYHKTLLAQGVQGYSWDTCWNDYRRHVACMLLIPMWQYTVFNIEYDKWINNVSSLIMSYKSLHCDQL